jgi:hypothetical protein
MGVVAQLALCLPEILAQSIDLRHGVGRQLPVQIIPWRHEVDEDVLVRPNAEIVVEQPAAISKISSLRRRRGYLLPQVEQK